MKPGPKPKMRVPVTVNLPPALVAALDEHARERFGGKERKRSELIVELLNRAVAAGGEGGEV